MIDFQIAELLNDSICTLWLERHLHADGFRCPRCRSTERRLFRAQGAFPANRCRACEAYYTLLTGTAFEKTRQLIQANLNETAPTGLMTGTAFEADELYQNAGRKNTPHPHPADPPWRRANKRKGHGTYANERPPIISIVSRDTGEYRFWVCDHAAKRTGDDLIAQNVPVVSTLFYTDEWQGYHGSHAAHASVRHSAHEWARDDDGDGRREVHCNPCEGAGAALRTYLRAF
jgi:transposase